MAQGITSCSSTSQSKPFFISDTHFGHANVIRYCERPFADADAMDAAIIAAWNAVVCQSDNVYVLGDVSFAGIERTCAILKRLAGRKHLVAGNHDQYMRRKEPFRDCFEWVVDYHELAVVDEALPDGKQHIVMCHFPLVAWHRSRYGAWMLHGHMHGKLGHNQDMRRHDVGVDVNDFAPVSYDALVQRFVGCPAPTRD